MQVAQALSLELVSLTLNPRGTLYKDRSLFEITQANANADALEIFERQIETQPWRVYRVRRIYAAKKDDAGRDMPERKGNANRAVEHVSAAVSMSQAKTLLRQKAEHTGLPLTEKRGISYLYVQRTGPSFPTREEYFVAGPAVVEEKARYGLEWFEEQ